MTKSKTFEILPIPGDGLLWVCIVALCGLPAALVAEDASAPRAEVIIVQGAPGTDAYQEMFGQWSTRWLAAARKGNGVATLIGQEADSERNDRELLRQALAAKAVTSDQPLWVVLIGHGTFDRKTARFNLRGPDVSADELADWLKPCERPVAVIDCSACSAPFLAKLSHPGRVVISATKTGGEENFTRFGEFLSASITDPAADLDKDDQTSLWEAFLAASRRTEEFYSGDGRLQTEHALLDDNGDQLGTRADLFQGLQLKDGLSAGSPVDGSIAHQWHLLPSGREAALPPDVRKQRDQLELQIIKLRERKTKLEADEYYRQLEALLVELARLNR